MMKMRNKNGLIHAALSALDRPPRLLGLAISSP
jgi:hypothetical protein